MYQKILEEALQELKQGELRDLLPEHMITSYVADCQIETDLEF
jgi:glutamine synthetase